MRFDADVLVIGAGHAGLGVAARLKARHREPLIVSADERVGDTWRRRWASLRLFTPRFANALPGARFPDARDPFPGKDEVADYEGEYAGQLGIPIRTRTVVRRVGVRDGGFEVVLRDETIRAKNVVVATGAHRDPRVPEFAASLGDRVTQLHSKDYGTFARLPAGPVVVVGGRNSGAEIAHDLSTDHDVTLSLSGDWRYAPNYWRSPAMWRVAQFRSWLLRGRILPPPFPWPLRPPLGGWVEVDLERATRERRLRLAPRTVAVGSDEVRFADGTSALPRTVIWATGFRNDDSWIEVPQTPGGIVVDRHCRAPVGGLYVLRAPLLASLHWGALAIAADVARRT